MGKSKKAPYEAQIKELERTGQVKLIGEHNIYAVLVKAQVSVRGWRKDGREYQETDTLNPGMVLYPRPRVLSKWERKLPPEEQEALGINLEWNQVWVVHRYPDLWGAIRQRGRHIIDHLTEEKVVINKELEVVIPGEAQRMREIALILNNFTQRFLVEKILPQLRENFAQGIFPIYQELEGTRSRFNTKIAELLKQAVEGRKIETAAKLAEAAAKVLKRWVEILDIAENCLKQAENWLLLCREIEIKVGWAHKRLAKLTGELSEIPSSGKTFSLAKLKEIVGELGGILIYLNQEVLFEPYYQRVKDPAVKNLAKAKDNLEKGDKKAIRNLARRALSKLGAIVLKEKPTITEIRRRRRALPKG